MKLSTIITEAPERPTKQQTQSRVSQDWDSLFGGPTNVPAARPQQTAPQQTQQPQDKGPGAEAMKTVSGERTRQRMGGVRPSNDMLNKLTQMDLDQEDVISNDQARMNAGIEEPRDPGTDVAVPQGPMNAVATAVNDDAGVIPEWHAVKHLPAYLIQGIRAIGRQVFAPFTSTPIEDIQVLANIGDGPNEQEELDAVLQYLKNHGKRSSEAELEFQERIPNYGAKVRMYMALGYTFMVVKDFAGNYIYAWPSKVGDGLGGEPPELADRSQRRIK